MNIAVIGLGLIGGSIAKTIKLHEGYTVYGYDINAETMAQAVRCGAVDNQLNNESLRKCSFIFVALYPQAITKWVRANSGYFSDEAILIDCGGVKRYIVNELHDLTKKSKWHFIGGHPMAGREFSGFSYAKDDMFDRASMILTPDADENPEIVRKVKNFFLDIGFRRVQITTPEEHDEMIAYTSQLAHIVSSAYVKCPRAGKHKGFSAGSFADMTRVARLNEDMWTELFFENKEPLLQELDGIVERLTAYRDALRDDRHDVMHDLLKEGRIIKEKLSE